MLGKHSGRAALRERVKELGFELSDAELARVFDDFKALADKKKEVYDGDIEALVLKNEIGSVGARGTSRTCTWSAIRRASPPAGSCCATRMAAS